MNKQQLANRIWASANKMRSKIDANEYKDYILGLVFYKFLSDNEVSYLIHKAGWTEDALHNLVNDINDENSQLIMDYCKNNIGYFIEYKHLFSTWLRPDSNFNVGDLSEAISAFDRQVGGAYKAVYKDIFKTLQAGLSKLGENPAGQTRALKDLIKLIKDIPTDSSQDYDVLGYVYEYLISNFAANAGKKAGEFYTPHEVAMLMSEIVAEHHQHKQQIEIYDPTSGSGSLLITIGKSVGRHIADKNRVKYYAQELKENTYNLTRMNLVMRGILPGNINTRCADSLDEDWPVQPAGSHIGKPLYVDAVVSNPPYSQHWNPADKEMDARFSEYGVAPKSKADYAFLLHELHHLKPDGILTIVLPHGVLFRGGEEEQIRANLIEKNNIDAIIGLPANIFFGTGIPTLIMVLKQHRDNDDVLIIDASKGYVKEGKNNKLRACDIKRIADTVRDRTTIPGFSRTVSRDTIRENGYNLNIPRYVDSGESTEQFDIYATMYGGIPHAEIDGLKAYWEALPTLRTDLFRTEANSPYAVLKTGDTLTAIEENTDVKQLKQHFADAFAGFADALHARLIDNVESVEELKAQDEIADDIFSRLEAIPLVDKYAAYQALADGWQPISNDVETLKQEGFDAARMVEPAYKLVKKNEEDIEVADGWKGRIIPFELVQQVKFQAELHAIRELVARVEVINGELGELRDGFSADEAEQYLDSEKDNAFDKKAITGAAKSKSDDVDPDTKAKLKTIADLWDELTKTNKKITSHKQSLINKTMAAIESLTDEEVAMFLHQKWIDPICRGIDNTLVSALSMLENKVKYLGEKYAVSYQQLNEELETAQDELAELIGQLTGDEYAIQGLNELVKGGNVWGLQSMFPQEGETIPRIRFKGFEGEWRKEKADNIFKTFNEKNCSGLPVLSATQDKGMMPRDSIGYHIFHDKSNEATYKHILPGQFVIHLRSFQGGFAHSSIEGIASPAYTVLDFKSKEDHHDYFWKYVFSSKDFVKRLELITYGIRDGRSINFGEFAEMYFIIPSKAEQQKIASFLSSLDRQIALQSRRLDKLKQIKAACLDKMFV